MEWQGREGALTWMWTARRLAISAFLIGHMGAVSIWVLPPCPIQRRCAGTLAYYILPLGLWQYWGMFAPDPVRDTLMLEAEAIDVRGIRYNFAFPKLADYSRLGGDLPVPPLEVRGQHGQRGERGAARVRGAARDPAARPAGRRLPRRRPPPLPGPPDARLPASRRPTRCCRRSRTRSRRTASRTWRRWAHEPAPRLEHLLVRADLGASAGGVPDRLRGRRPGQPGAADGRLRPLVHRRRALARDRGPRGRRAAPALALAVGAGPDLGPGRLRGHGDRRRPVHARLADPADGRRALPGHALDPPPQRLDRLRGRRPADDPGLLPDAQPLRRRLLARRPPGVPQAGDPRRAPDRPLGATPDPAPDLPGLLQHRRAEGPRDRPGWTGRRSTSS